MKSPADLHGPSDILTITGKDEKDQPPDIIHQVHSLRFFALSRDSHRIVLPVINNNPSWACVRQLSRASQILLVSLLLGVNKLPLLLLLYPLLLLDVRELVLLLSDEGLGALEGLSSSSEDCCCCEEVGCCDCVG